MAAMTGMNAATTMAAKRAREMAAARAQGAPTAGMTPMAPANQQPSTQRGTIGTIGSTIGGMAGMMGGMLGRGKNKANLRDMLAQAKTQKAEQMNTPLGKKMSAIIKNRAMPTGRR